MMFVTIAIDLYLRQIVANRTEVEESQLARAVLDKIARDIRSVIVPVREEQLEVNTNSLTSLFGFSANLNSSELENLTTETNNSETSTPELSEQTTLYGTTPGIYGNSEWIQIDTALLPRGEMYGSRQIQNFRMADRLSPSKTTLYYLGQETNQITGNNDPRYQPDQLIGSLGRSPDKTAIRYGLFRRQLDRFVTQYALNEGLETEYEQYDELLAPEIEWIEFAYFDPTAGQEGSTGDWVETWDMDEQQILPTAIRITLAVRKQSFEQNSFAWINNNSTISEIVYSLVVAIPVTIEPPETQEEEIITTN
ncbi:MAG: type II secretion system protein GspJ [Planctomycetaceae bacterium]|nr:type II secretion system protein GspJ [Planctomycetaceae bacterium]